MGLDGAWIEFDQVPSITRVYRALKRKGYSKTKAATISNGLRKKRGHC